MSTMNPSFSLRTKMFVNGETNSAKRVLESIRLIVRLSSHSHSVPAYVMSSESKRELSVHNDATATTSLNVHDVIH